jgi:hypothetical protein
MTTGAFENALLIIGLLGGSYLATVCFIEFALYFDRRRKQ